MSKKKKIVGVEIMDSPIGKVMKSRDYNYIFDKQTGSFMRWGRTKDDDPLWSPYGPEIMDIEVTTICKGIEKHGPCKFCYKSNTPNGINMSLETFKKILDKIPPTITQVAFGADAQAESNPDLWAMMKYCMMRGVIPNITVAEANKETAKKLIDHCGAIAVSYYDMETMLQTIYNLRAADKADLEERYGKDAPAEQINKKRKQINIHALIAEETFDKTMDLLRMRAMGMNEALNSVHAIIMLSLKPKGRGKSLNRLSQEKFTELVQFAQKHNIPIGFDSCSAFKFLEAVKGSANYKMYEQCAEPCESTCFSMYVNTEGKFFPCSFTEEEDNWEGIDMTNIDNFVKDVWNNPKTKEYRDKILSCKRKCRGCFHYEV